MLTTTSSNPHLRTYKPRKEADVTDRSDLGDLVSKCVKSMYVPGPTFFEELSSQFRDLFEKQMCYGAFKKQMDIMLARLIERKITENAFEEAYAELAEAIETHSGLRRNERSQLDAEMVHLLDAAQIVAVENANWASAVVRQRQSKPHAK